ncbi:hypothetical protein JCM8547_003464 [Rhodosporidiobolus lusitaniae]
MASLASSSSTSALPARVAHQLAQATRLNPQLNAFTRLASLSDLERQHQAASSSHREKARLKGKTVAIKDNFVTGGEGGETTTCASRMLRDYRSPFTATVVSRLQSAGALTIGKTNMDEFGMGSANVHSHFGPVINPAGPQGIEESLRDGAGEGGKDERRVPGGSSGGSAAAVAAGLCDFALASDTGGSTRLPASYTCIVGFKPSYGLLSRYGLVAYASSLDTVGLMSREIGGREGGLGEVFDILEAHDPQDPTSAPLSARERASKAHAALLDRLSSSSPTADKPLAGVRIGVPSDLFPLPPLSPLLSPRGPIRTFLRTLRDNLGASLVPVRLKTAPLGLSAYYVIASAEAGSNLARFRGVEYGFRSSFEGALTEDGERQQLFARTRAEGFGEEVKKRVLLGAFALSAEAFDNYFLQAQRVRRLLQLEIDALFRTPSPLRPSLSSPSPSSASPSASSRQADGVDFLLHPSALSTAPLLSSYLSSTSSSAPSAPKQGSRSAYTQDLLSLPASLAGLPALSLPAGRTRVEDEGGDGWPVGMTLVGQWGADREVLDLARRVERALKARCVCEV